MRSLMRTTDSVALLVIRVFLGLVFFPHGAQKVLGWFGGGGFSATLHAFTKQGMPAPMALLVMAAEFLGSLGVLTGLLTRVASFGIASVMVGAIAMVHAQFGFFMNWFGQQKGEGFEYHLLALGMALALVVGGGGRASLDRALTRN
jgi:putative oxidoreductase